ncbi:hypothetical protein MPSEU_000070400 [Mayamaea pseudoterrestris]|nr:hypothetical protein MPSEU_000070400 [Mayamaea pseudoterrestris]
MLAPLARSLGVSSVKLKLRMSCSSSIARTLRMSATSEWKLRPDHSHPIIRRTFGSNANDDGKPVEDESRISQLLYESPLGTVVTRLRTVSLATGVCGSLGLPLVISLKGGELPTTGLLATGIMFCMMSWGSTAAVHYIFHPYVYEIYKIPVRLCSSKKPNEDDHLDAAVQSKTDIPTPADPTTLKGPFLFKAVSKSLFLGRTETVFDPSLDLAAYEGYRPMCNFTAKGVPLYVHPQMVNNKELKDALHFLTNIPEAVPTKENPDDFL